MKAQLIKRFEDEIALLERELTQELPKEIQRAREHGDLRENAEYHAAKERQRFVEARVSMLRQRVSELQMMNLEKIPHDKVGFGSKLTLREGDRTSMYELVMPEDANPDRGAGVGRVAHRPGALRQGRGRHRPGADAGRRPRVRDLSSSPFTTSSSAACPETPYSPRQQYVTFLPVYFVQLRVNSGGSDNADQNAACAASEKIESSQLFDNARRVMLQR